MEPLDRPRAASAAGDRAFFFKEKTCPEERGACTPRGAPRDGSYDYAPSGSPEPAEVLVADALEELPASDVGPSLVSSVAVVPVVPVVVALSGVAVVVSDVLVSVVAPLGSVAIGLDSLAPEVLTVVVPSVSLVECGGPSEDGTPYTESPQPPTNDKPTSTTLADRVSGRRPNVASQWGQRRSSRRTWDPHAGHGVSGVTARA